MTTLPVNPRGKRLPDSAILGVNAIGDPDWDGIGPAFAHLDLDTYGRRRSGTPLAATADMISPVRCSFCRRIYDLSNGEVVQRYADCTVFKTPCCGRTADDRTWKPRPDFIRVDGSGREER